MTQTAFSQLLDHVKKTTALEQVGGILGWDQETMMPPKGAEDRATQTAALAEVIHARATDPRVGDWLAEIDADQLDAADARSLDLIAKEYMRERQVPGSLAAELARLSSAGQTAWVAARKAGSFKDFAPMLTEILQAKRDYAACIRGDGQSLYDALLDTFEPDMTSARLDDLFTPLRAALVEIAGQAREAAPLEGQFATDQQLALARDLAATFGYDAEAGRLDLSVHPFSSGQMGDVRITTRVDEADPLNCIYSTIHETGHAVYEQNIDGTRAFTPVGHHCSMGVHESQSRLFENQIGRSRPFMDHLHRQMTDRFGTLSAADADALYASVNRVAPGYIRTEADEVHYNLHVMMRFDLERDLVEGRLEVADLEEAWNARFASDFGMQVPDVLNGVLQDVHWSAGLFGYFPTYSLGNLYAASLTEALRADFPDLDDLISRADLGEVIGWLNTHVHHHGRLYPAIDLMETATGQPLSAEPLIGYLRAKFG